MDRWDEIFDLLERPDKWSLGGGRAVLWAPEFPQHLEVPGFWDPGTYYHLKVGPLFTMTLLAENHRPLPLHVTARRWKVSHLALAHEAGPDFAIMERRSLSPEDVLVSELEIKNNTPYQRTLDIVIWTSRFAGSDRPDADFLTGIQPASDRLLLAHQVNNGKGKPVMTFNQAIGSMRDADSWAVNLSQDQGDRLPRWEFTPFVEKFGEKGLPREVVTKGGPEGTLSGWTVYAAMHYRLILPAGIVRKFSAGVAIARVGNDATLNLKRALGVHSPSERAARTWRSFFQSVPYFRCTDPYVERCYWYRWYGLRLNMVLPADYGHKYPCVFEGINAGWFRHAISYSAQVHARELRWSRDRSLAPGSVLNFLEAQRPNGEIPAALGAEFEPPGAKGMYHANWGRVVRELYAINPDKNFLRAVYGPLVKYAQYFMKKRDREKSWLFDVVNQGETGQEYMSRYLFADEQADRWGPLQLKGIDATVYAYELFRALAWAAGVLGQKREVRRWTAAADATRSAVRKRMYDAGIKMFVDVQPGSMEKSPAKAAVGFYPFTTDIATAEHLDAIRDNLLNERVFWTEFPVVSTSMDDPTFSATGEWKGVRMNCPWSGRSWLMTSSHVAEALAEAATKLDEGLRVKASELLRNLIHMTFIDRDPARPTSYEYYNPLTGQPCWFRGTDDYMHSYIADLILRYVAGLRPDADGNLTVDPLPFGLKRLAVDNLRIRGHEVALDMIGGRGRLTIDGKLSRFNIGKPVTVKL